MGVGDTRRDYTVVGAGAIGGTVGARLVRDGRSVLFCDASRDHVDAINAGGLRITGPEEEFVVAATAVVPEQLPPALGRVLIAVKAQHTETALAEIAPRLAADGFVVSLQNGLNEPAVAAAVGAEQTVGGFVNFGADYFEPGVIFFGGHGAFFVGELDGRPSKRVQALVADLVHSQSTGNIFGYLWSKLAYTAILAATALSDRSMADSLEHPRYRRLFVALADEVLTRAEAPPEPFDGFDPVDLDGSITRLADFNRSSGKTHSGIYRDLAVRHRPTEVEALLGSLDGPLVRRTRELIRDIEDGRRRCQQANLELLAEAAA